jgi:hypothetical protein
MFTLSTLDSHLLDSNYVFFHFGDQKTKELWINYCQMKAYTGRWTRILVSTCVQLSLGRMNNIEYIHNKKMRESVQFCTVRRKPWPWAAVCVFCGGLPAGSDKINMAR